MKLFFFFKTRVLRNDFARYNVDVDDIENLECDEYGWKIIRGDVFRFPPHKSLFCAILGKFIFLLYYLFSFCLTFIMHLLII